jgi:hypothetical protein
MGMKDVPKRREWYPFGENIRGGRGSLAPGPHMTRDGGESHPGMVVRPWTVCDAVPGESG